MTAASANDAEARLRKACDVLQAEMERWDTIGSVKITQTPTCFYIYLPTALDITESSSFADCFLSVRQQLIERGSRK